MLAAAVSDVAFHRLHPRHGLGHHARSFTLLGIDDRAPQFDDPVADHHVDHVSRRPRLTVQFRKHGFADGFVCLGTGRRDGEARQRMQQIGAADNPNQLTPAHDRNALDAKFFHDGDDVA